MDVSALATSLGTGFATGLMIVLGIAIVCISASWAGNRMVYHAPFMRFIIMILAACVSPFLFIWLVGYGWWRYIFSTSVMEYTWYFGLFPIWKDIFRPETAWLGRFGAYIGNLFRKPFYGDLEVINKDTGESYYTELIHKVYPAPSKEKDAVISKEFGVIDNQDGYNGPIIFPASIVRMGYVSEELFEAARYAASIPTIPKNDPQDPTPPPPPEWTELMKQLSSSAKHMYGVRV